MRETVRVKLLGGFRVSVGARAVAEGHIVGSELQREHLGELDDRPWRLGVRPLHGRPVSVPATHRLPHTLPCGLPHSRF